MSVFDRFMPAVSAYMQKIRDEGVQRLTAEPLFETFHLRDNVYSFLSKSPGRGGDAWMHLVIGTEKAMLVDTGFGIGNLKGIVESLTDKPLIVVNTHHHGDHSLGNFQFEKVYCHEYDVPYLKDQMNPQAQERFVPRDGSYYKTSDLVTFKEYEIVGLPDGYIFDLGGNYKIELFHLPGHAPGGCAFLDKTGRILYSGDAIVSTPTMITGASVGKYHGDFMTVTAFRDKLIRLAARKGEFDVLFPGHAILEFSSQVVSDMLTLCNAIIDEPDIVDLIDEGMRGSGNLSKLKIVGLASIAFNDERI